MVVYLVFVAALFGLAPQASSLFGGRLGLNRAGSSRAGPVLRGKLSDLVKILIWLDLPQIGL